MEATRPSSAPIYVQETNQVKKSTDDDGVKRINAYEVLHPCRTSVRKIAARHENPPNDLQAHSPVHAFTHFVSTVEHTAHLTCPARQV